MDQCFNILDRLANSKFRSRFKLRVKKLEYIKDKGFDTIYILPAILFGIELLRQNLLTTVNKLQCEDPLFSLFNTQPQLAVVVAIEKWHKFPKGRELTKIEQEYLVSVIMEWINRQINSISIQ